MAVKDWSSTPSSNTSILTGLTLDGSVLNVPLLDDCFREMAAQIAAQMGKAGFKGSDMPSAATVDLSTASGQYIDVTGSTTIASFGVAPAGQMYIVRFAGIMVLTHNASTLILPGSASITTAVGDTAFMMSLGAGAWKCVSYQPASGATLPFATADNAIARFDGTAGKLQNSGPTIGDTGQLVLSTLGQTDALIACRRAGNSIEFGHPTQTGYGSAIGAEATTGYPFIAFQSEAGTNVNTYRTRGLKGAVIRSDSLGGLVFGTLAGAAADNQTLGILATLNASGFLEIGAFGVGGDGKQINKNLIESSRIGTSAAGHIQFTNNNGVVGLISTAGSTTTYGPSSDERLKQNFRSFDGGAILDTINIYHFDWIAEGSGSGYGVKAQECHAVFPDAIHVGGEDPKKEPWVADYSKFVPLLIAEVKALRARIAALEAKA